jgi:hypothetical protein
MFVAGNFELTCRTKRHEKLNSESLSLYKFQEFYINLEGTLPYSHPSVT